MEMGGFEWLTMMLEKMAPFMEWVVLITFGLSFLVLGVMFIIALVHIMNDDRKSTIQRLEDKIYSDLFSDWKNDSPGE